MTDTTISAKLRILTPDDGMAITDGTTYTTGTVYLAHSADASRWHEIPESEIPPTPEPPQPRKRYSVYRLILGLKELGVLAPVVEWAKAHSLYEELVTVGVVDGEDADLMTALRELGASLGVTTEQIDALLAAAEEG